MRVVLPWIPDKGKFLRKAWAAASPWTQRIIVDALEMGPKVDVKLLISARSANWAMLMSQCVWLL
jgi:hypothetical protein